MRFSLVAGVRTEAAPRLRGTCPHCPPGADNVTIAKCGRWVTWHWAHKSRRHCDPWWEPETAWHRAWKERFPSAWQEVLNVDPVSGERHIADVKNGDGLVLEFQHSPLEAGELAAREAFYRRMVWVVDAAREGGHFRVALEKPAAGAPGVHPFQWFGRSTLFHGWRLARCPVFLDFGHALLWRLRLFDPRARHGEVEPLAREEFVAAHGGARMPAGDVVAEEISGWGVSSRGRSANRPPGSR